MNIQVPGRARLLDFTVGVSSACVFHSASRHLASSVHGDGFTIVGLKSALDIFVKELKEKYELKEAARLGPAPEDDKEGRVLNRIVRWIAKGLEYEADPRQSEKLVHELGLEGAKGVTTPAVKAIIEQIHRDKPIEERNPVRPN